jgi:hypothetical protein
MNSITKKSLGPASIEVAALSRINACLFYELAQVVSWGARNHLIVNEHPELGRLLESSTAALHNGGILEDPAQCLAA